MEERQGNHKKKYIYHIYLEYNAQIKTGPHAINALNECRSESFVFSDVSKFSGDSPLHSIYHKRVHLTRSAHELM